MEQYYVVEQGEELQGLVQTLSNHSAAIIRGPVLQNPVHSGVDRPIPE